MLSKFNFLLSSKKKAMFSADSIAILFLHSRVRAALCGDNITLSNLNNIVNKDELRA